MTLLCSTYNTCTIDFELCMVDNSGIALVSGWTKNLQRGVAQRTRKYKETVKWESIIRAKDFHAWEEESWRGIIWTLKFIW